MGKELSQRLQMIRVREGDLSRCKRKDRNLEIMLASDEFTNIPYIDLQNEVQKTA